MSASSCVCDCVCCVVCVCVCVQNSPVAVLERSVYSGRYCFVEYLKRRYIIIMLIHVLQYYASPPYHATTSYMYVHVLCVDVIVAPPVVVGVCSLARTHCMILPSYMYIPSLTVCTLGSRQTKK